MYQLQNILSNNYQFCIHRNNFPDQNCLNIQENKIKPIHLLFHSESKI